MALSATNAEGGSSGLANYNPPEIERTTVEVTEDEMRFLEFYRCRSSKEWIEKHLDDESGKAGYLYCGGRPNKDWKGRKAHLRQVREIVERMHPWNRVPDNAPETVMIPFVSAADDELQNGRIYFFSPFVQPVMNALVLLEGEVRGSDPLRTLPMPKMATEIDGELWVYNGNSVPVLLSTMKVYGVCVSTFQIDAYGTQRSSYTTNLDSPLPLFGTVSRDAIEAHREALNPRGLSGRV